MIRSRSGGSSRGASRVRVLAIPRDDNPYQAMLYCACASEGVEVAYAGEFSPSRTLNLLALPIELLVRRLRGWNVLHLHWTFAFAVVGSSHFPVLYRAASAWFLLVLAVARLLGYRVVWTAHNVLPHSRIFHDDLAMRRHLVRLADLVIVHSSAAEDALSSLVGSPRRVEVIPHPAFVVEPLETGLAKEGPIRLLFFGRVADYKGVDDLLLALQRAGPRSDATLTVAGDCSDGKLRKRLLELARELGERVHLRLDRIPDEEIPQLLGTHDILILPFRHSTTSGSALLGLGAGIPVAVTDLPTFEGMPVLRFEPGAEGLVRFLESMSRDQRPALRDLGDRGRAWVEEQASWSGVGVATTRAFRELIAA